MTGNGTDRLQALLLPLFLQDIQPDPVHGNRVAAEENAVVANNPTVMRNWLKKIQPILQKKNIQTFQPFFYWRTEAFRQG